MQSEEEREWFAQAFESTSLATAFTPAERLNIHSLLGPSVVACISIGVVPSHLTLAVRAVQSEVFDKFMGVKFR